MVNNKEKEVADNIKNTESVFAGSARYFIVKSNTYENLETSMQHGAWATTIRPTKKLSTALKTCDHIILIFSVNESSCFQGMARMEKIPDASFKPELFKSYQSPVAGHSQLNFMSNFKISWLVKCSFPFRELDFFPGNPLNDGLPVCKSFNGQEILPEVGNYLCHLMYQNAKDKKELAKITNDAKGGAPNGAPDPYQRVVLRRPEDLKTGHHKHFQHTAATIDRINQESIDQRHHQDYHYNHANHGPNTGGNNQYHGGNKAHKYTSRKHN